MLRPLDSRVGGEQHGGRLSHPTLIRRAASHRRELRFAFFTMRRLVLCHGDVSFFTARAGAPFLDFHVSR